MASTAEIFESILTMPPTARIPIAYNYLVPNIRGIQNMVSILDKLEYPTPPPSPNPEQAPATSASDPNEMDSKDPVPTSSANTTEISLFAAATETFSRTNTNCTIQESLDRCRPIITLAKTRDLRVRGYVSVALGCPYEGPDVDPHKVAEMTASLLEMGCDEVSVADTTGMGTAPRTRRLLQTLKDAGIQNEDVALHFHDTYGQALVNTVVGLEHGIRVFDSSVGGLGGCPYSKGATGNVATEDLLHLLHSLGVQTGVDLEKMAEIGAWISGELERANDSRAGKAILARLKG
jgi:hydroxymethylglutaryl-CoA lyase